MTVQPEVRRADTFHELFTTAAETGASFAARAAHFDQTAAFPFENFDALAARGLLPVTVTAAEGGHGGGLLAAQTVIASIAQGEPSTALVLAMHFAHHAAIARGGRWPDHVAARLVTETLNGGIALINSAQVEPKAGSPSHGTLPDTVARRKGDHWVISGHKQYVTGIPLLSWISVLACTDDPDPRIGLFLVPAKSPGIRVVETWDAVGMRATASHDVILDNVAIPFDYTSELTPAREGMKRDEATGTWFFILVASVYAGIARSARNWIVDWVRNHIPGGLSAPLATVPAIRDAIGQIDIRLATNRRLLDSIARDADAGLAPGPEAGIVKNVVTDNAIWVTEMAMEIAGNYGTRRANPLERHHRDALCGRAHAPQNAIVRGIVAGAALGRP